MSSTSTSSAPSATWVYPPFDANAPPLTDTSNFGPVHLQDWMLLEWEPKQADFTVALVCFSAGGAVTNNIVAQNASNSPLLLEFNQKQNSEGSLDEIYCHLWSKDSGAKNTVNFRFNNTPAAGAPVTYRAANAATSAPVSTATLSTISATFSASSTQTVQASTSSSSSHNSHQKNNGTGLTSRAIAGIAVGVIVGVLVLAAILGYLLWRRQKQSTVDVDADYKYDPAPAYPDHSESKDDAQHAELPARPLAEMESGPVHRDPKKPLPNELSGHDGATELPA
ncbi:Hypothetical protein R9X50_00184900 [Acrodontium crateriforme]|uniref:Mid2 domain-containing protein n=1 Tax=Acrodontium crateriforme TaxID=150365 RepID=A0AAQ3M1G0_9PEZI|nr:Hypothetical protein R9X50_00184900 [Acrodontium crateriforme]